MAYFKVTGTNGQSAIINGNAVSKVVDFGSYRTIYQNSEVNNHQVTDSLDEILASLNGG